VGDNEELSPVRDALAIRALCERYAQAVDAGDIDAFVAVFTSDGHLVSNYTGNHYHGREQLADVVIRTKAIASTSMHVIGNHVADIDGDTATGVTYCIANHLRDDRSNLVMMVRYVDKYSRSSDGAWLIADRSVEVQWTETHQADPADR
jgi:uncharacterized protein (TIGR02246 family)